MDVTINIIDFLFWFVGAIAIWALLPREFKEELGSLVGFFIMVVWTVACIVFLGFLDYDLSITFK
jgi:hypothetical protein